MFVQKWPSTGSNWPSKHVLPWGRLWLDSRNIKQHWAHRIEAATKKTKTSKTTAHNKVDLNFGGARTFRSAQTYRKCHQRQPIGPIFVIHWVKQRCTWRAPNWKPPGANLLGWWCTDKPRINQGVALRIHWNRAAEKSRRRCHLAFECFWML